MKRFLKGAAGHEHEPQEGGAGVLQQRYNEGRRQNEMQGSHWLVHCVALPLVYKVHLQARGGLFSTVSCCPGLDMMEGWEVGGGGVL